MAEKLPEKRWIPETLFDDLGFRMSFQVDRVLYELQTDHQHLILFEQAYFGKMLMLDGATQISKRDEFIYQEMMSHVPLFAHGAAQDVLIVGGGDCGIAEEVLKHKTVKRLTQVEIDAKVVEFAKEHFPEFTTPVFADKRFESVIDDGAKYVAKTDRRFDVIIVDSTDPQGPGKILFGEKFYSGCRRCIKKGGVLVTQNGVPFFQKNELAATMSKFRRLFADASCYVAAIPVYVGGHMAMGIATDNKRLRRHPVKTIAQRYRKAGSFKTKYWTPEVHVAAFAQPRFIADLVAKAAKKKK
jgi:spermidine synthase